MNNVKAKGQLRHCFFGTYSAVIALGFDDEKSALDALPKLPGFEQSKKSSNALVWQGDSNALEAVKTLLGTFGADVKKIASLARSIDFGEPFEIVVPVTPSEQASLF